MPVRSVLTLGHGTLSVTGFLEVVRRGGVGAIADVRRFPGSRRWPHLAGEEMRAWLADAGVRYDWIPELGGRRKPSADVTNGAWRNAQFRAYADHMATAEFEAGLVRLDSLRDATADAAIAVMCSESVWWRCHRRLLADHLVVVRDVEVEHLFHDGRRTRHPVPAEAVVVDGHLTYPPRESPEVGSDVAPGV